MIVEDKNIEFIDESPPTKTVSRGGSFKDFIDGSVLTRDFMVKQLPYIFFLAVLGILYIGNRYHSEKLVRRSAMLQTELKELRAEAITVSANLMHLSRQSEVLKLLRQNDLNLLESLEPPKKIIVQKSNR